MKTALRSLAAILVLTVAAFAQLSLPQNASAVAHQGGTYYAAGFFSAEGRVLSGNTSTGSQSIIIAPNGGGGSGIIQLADGTSVPLAVLFNVTNPLLVDYGQVNQETVTPTAVSIGSCPAGNLGVGGTIQCATITASFSNTHGQSAVVRDGGFGVGMAASFANNIGGGEIVVDSVWSALGGTSAILAAATPFSNVTIEDLRGAAVQYWNVQQTASTFLAAPATLTAVTALPSATPVGAYGTGTYHLAIACVDVAGQVGPISADFSEAGLATGSFIFSAPAAQTGCVGWIPYISLTGGTYSLIYQVPVLASEGTLTKIETVTPAFAITNATYGQTGSAATITAITVSTSPVGMLLGGVSGTFLTGNPNGRTTYAYVASSHAASFGIPTVSLPFTAGGIGSATPIAIGTVNIPAGVLNQVGKAIRICGEYINTDVNSVAQMIQIYLDAAGSDVAGSPVKIGNMQAGAGPGTAATYKGHFCEDFHTSVSGAGATAGTIFPDFSLFNYYLASAPAINMLGGEIGTAGVGSLNLAGGGGFENRISIVHTNTTGNNTPTLQNLTLEVL